MTQPVAHVMIDEHKGVGLQGAIGSGTASHALEASHPVKISVFNHGQDTLPGTAEVTWDEVASSLANVRSAPCALDTCARSDCVHKNGRGWSPVEYAPGTTRGLRGVVSVHALVVDIDHVPDENLPALLERVQAYKRVVHASHSDKPGDRCLRVVLALSRPVLAADWPKFWRAALTLLDLPGDESTKDSSRLYYTPSRPSDACAIDVADGTGFAYESADGAFIDVDEVLLNAPEVAVPKPEFEHVIGDGSLPEDAARLVAIEALADAWPATGRHRASLALAGALARAGWDEQAVAEFVYEVSERASPGNGDFAKRLTQARTSVAKVAEGGSVAGWPTVQELLGARGRAAVDVACGSMGVGSPPRDENFMTQLFARRPYVPDVPGETPTSADASERPLGAALPTRGEIYDAVRMACRKNARATKLEKIRDKRLLSAVVRGTALADPDEDQDRALAEASIALMRVVPMGTSDQQVAEMLSASALGRDGDSLIEYARLAREHVATRRAAPAADVLDDVEGEFKVAVSGPNAGKPVANSASNVRLAALKMGIYAAYDEFASVVMLSYGDNPPHRLEDNDLTQTTQDIENRFGFYPTKDLMNEALMYLARKNKYHPVREYLSELKWDGVKRLETWLIDTAGAPDTPYVRAVSRLVLVAACRRVMSPGAKFDEMVVLESPQGLGKSTALRILAVRDEWFGDDLRLDGDTKQQMEQTDGKWIIEAPELKGMSQGDHNTLKAYLSRQVDRARLAYARASTECPRQFIVVGSTNDRRYLKDDTGNRRYLPIMIVAFDLAMLRVIRDQLWAEAYEYERASESIRLDQSLWEAAAAEQREREVEDSYEIQLAPVFANLVGKVRIQDVWKVTGGDNPRVPSNLEQARISSAMFKLGWERGRKRFEGDREHCYVRGTKIEQSVQIHVVGGPQGWSITTTTPAVSPVVTKPAN